MQKLSIRRKVAIAGLTTLLILLLLLNLQIVPDATTENSRCVTGRIAHIEEGGTKDVVFKLEHDHATYYINRGLEQGLDWATVKQLEGKEAVLHYVKHWSPLSALSQVKHLARVEVEGKILYDEIKK